MNEKRDVFGSYLFQFFILSLLIIPAFPLSEADPPVNGDWVITGPETYSNRYFTVRGNLIVRNGGDLTLTDTILEIESVANGTRSITVETGGRLTAVNTIIRSTDPGRRFGFVCNDTLILDKSTIRDLGGTPEWEKGITIRNNSSVLGNSTVGGPSHTGIFIESYSTTLHNITVTGHAYGIRAVNSTGVLVSECIIEDDWGCGIYGSNSYGQITCCTVRRCGGGMAFDLGSRMNISRNVISGNAAIGIGLNGVTCIINKNTIANNSQKGIHVERDCNDTLIDDNVIEYNGDGTQAGIFVLRHGCTIRNNVIRGNDYGITVSAYALYPDPYNATPLIDNNTICNNTYSGVHLQQGGTAVLLNNTLSGNGLDGAFSTAGSGFVRLEGNLAERNGRNGFVHARDNGLTAVNNTARHNMHNGIYSDTPNGIIAVDGGELSCNFENGLYLKSDKTSARSISVSNLSTVYNRGSGVRLEGYPMMSLSGIRSISNRENGILLTNLVNSGVGVTATGIQADENVPYGLFITANSLDYIRIDSFSGSNNIGPAIYIPDAPAVTVTNSRFVHNPVGIDSGADTITISNITATDNRNACSLSFNDSRNPSKVINSTFRNSTGADIKAYQSAGTLLLETNRHESSAVGLMASSVSKVIVGNSTFNNVSGVVMELNGTTELGSRSNVAVNSSWLLSKKSRIESTGDEIRIGSGKFAWNIFDSVLNVTSFELENSGQDTISNHSSMRLSGGIVRSNDSRWIHLYNQSKMVVMSITGLTPSSIISDQTSSEEWPLNVLIRALDSGNRALGGAEYIVEDIQGNLLSSGYINSYGYTSPFPIKKPFVDATSSLSYRGVQLSLTVTSTDLQNSVVDATTWKLSLDRSFNQTDLFCEVKMNLKPRLLRNQTLQVDRSLGEFISIPLYSNITDPDDGPYPLSYELSASDKNEGMAIRDGTFTWTPPRYLSGSRIVQITVTDQGDQDNLDDALLILLEIRIDKPTLMLRARIENRTVNENSSWMVSFKNIFDSAHPMRAESITFSSPYIASITDYIKWNDTEAWWDPLAFGADNAEPLSVLRDITCTVTLDGATRVSTPPFTVQYAHAQVHVEDQLTNKAFRLKLNDIFRMKNVIYDLEILNADPFLRDIGTPITIASQAGELAWQTNETVFPSREYRVLVTASKENMSVYSNPFSLLLQGKSPVPVSRPMPYEFRNWTVGQMFSVNLHDYFITSDPSSLRFSLLRTPNIEMGVSFFNDTSGEFVFVPGKAAANNRLDFQFRATDKRSNRTQDTERFILEVRTDAARQGSVSYTTAELAAMIGLAAFLPILGIVSAFATKKYVVKNRISRWMEQSRRGQAGQLLEQLSDNARGPPSPSVVFYVRSLERDTGTSEEFCHEAIRLLSRRYEPEIIDAVGGLMTVQLTRTPENMVELLWKWSSSGVPAVAYAGAARRAASGSALRALIVAYEDLIKSNERDVKDRLFKFISVMEEMGISPEDVLLYSRSRTFMVVNSLSQIASARNELTALEETRDPKNHPLQNSLGELGLITSTLSKYELSERPEDRLAYLSEAIDQIEQANHEIAQNTVLPDSVILKSITSQWRNLIHSTIKSIRGKAEMLVDVKSKILPETREPVSILISVSNRGRVPAENVVLKVLPSSAYGAITQELELRTIGAEETQNIQVELRPFKIQSFRLELELTYDDIERKGKSMTASEMLMFRTIPTEFISVPNPYIVGTPINTGSPMFVGRQKIIEFIRANLSGATHDNILVLYGQRRTGKTTLLKQLLASLSDRYVPVFVDIQGIIDPGMDSFFYTISSEIRDALEKARYPLELPEYEDFAKRPARTFEKDVLEPALAAIGEKRLVLMIDEFEELENKVQSGLIDKNIFSYLRHLMQHTRKIAFIFAGTHKMEEMGSDYWSILFNIAIYQTIGYLSEDEARQLIETPVKQFNMIYDEMAIEKIIRVTASHPYFVQLVCHTLVNYHNQSKRNFIRLQDVDDELKSIIGKGHMHFEFLWKGLNKKERILLSFVPKILSEGLAVTSPEVKNRLELHNLRASEQEVAQTLKTLAVKEILREKFKNGVQYTFKIDLVRMWVENYRQIERTLGEEGTW